MARRSYHQGDRGPKLPPWMVPKLSKRFRTVKREGTKSKGTLALRAIQPSWRYHILDHPQHGLPAGTEMINTPTECFRFGSRPGIMVHNRRQARQLGLQSRPKDGERHRRRGSKEE